MSVWEQAHLGDVADINPRFDYRSGPLTPASFVRMANVSAESASVVHEEVRQVEDVAKGYTAFNRGDILVAKITPCFENGKIAAATINHAIGFGSTEFHVVRPHDTVLDRKFLLHYLRQPRVRLEGEQRMTGSGGQRRVPTQFLQDLSIPLPPLAEQRRIVDVLDRTEALREKRLASVAILQQLPQALFIESFGDPLENSKAWPTVVLSDVLDGIDGGWSPVCLDRPIIDGEWGVLKLGAVTWCEYDASSNKALPPGVIPRPDLEVKPGDLLFTRKNTPDLVAACALVRGTPPRLMLSDLVFRLRIRTNAPVVPEYLHQLLVNPRKRRDIQKLAGGSAGSMPNISKAKLRDVRIGVPPLELQRAYTEQVDQVERLLSAQRVSLRELDRLFASVQSRAFRGEL